MSKINYQQTYFLGIISLYVNPDCAIIIHIITKIDNTNKFGKTQIYFKLFSKKTDNKQLIYNEREPVSNDKTLKKQIHRNSCEKVVAGKNVKIVLSLIQRLILNKNIFN